MFITYHFCLGYYIKPIQFQLSLFTVWKHAFLWTCIIQVDCAVWIKLPKSSYRHLFASFSGPTNSSTNVVLVDREEQVGVCKWGGYDQRKCGPGMTMGSESETVTKWRLAEKQTLAIPHTDVSAWGSGGQPLWHSQPESPLFTSFRSIVCPAHPYTSWLKT